jgi:alkyl hydroperoxide reductase subunit AhpF
MLGEISRLSQRISVSVHDFYDEASAAGALGIDRIPGIAIRGQANRTLRFSGIPLGTLFPTFIDTLIDASRPSVDLKADTLRQLKRLKEDVSVWVFAHPSCPHSPAVARLAFKLALASPRLIVEVIEVVEFPAMVERLDLSATPTTLLGERLALTGAVDEATLVQAVLRVAEGKPVASSEFKTGAASALQFQQQQQSLQRPATTAGGIYLPR